MSNRSRKFARLSRDRGFIIKASLLMTGVALMLSGLMWAIKPAAIAAIAKKVKVDEFADEMGTDLDPDLSADQLAAVIRNRQLFRNGLPAIDYHSMNFHKGEGNSEDYDLIKSRVSSSTSINEGERDRLLLLLDALHSVDLRNEAIKKLNSIEANKRYRNAFLGDAYLAAGEAVLGIESYAREGGNYPELARYSQRSAVIAYMERREPVPLKKLLVKPGFKKTLSVDERVDASVLARDYGGLFGDIVLVGKERLLSFGFIICLLGASIWFSVFIAIGAFDKKVIVFSLIALLLGFVSDILTLYLVTIQNQIQQFKFDPEGPFIDQLIAMICGVGLREEACKLICFVPLLIVILKYRNPILVLITAGMTGLGFAFLENVGYLFRSTIDSPIMRLLSANALHISLTGIVGFSLYQVVINRGRRWENFLMDFLLVMAVHGVYNSFLAIPMLQEYSLVSMILMAVMVYRYLDLIRDHLDFTGIHTRLSPIGVLVLSTVLFACILMLLNAFTGGLQYAIAQYLGVVASSVVLSFVFINRFRDL